MIVIEITPDTDTHTGTLFSDALLGPGQRLNSNTDLQPPVAGPGHPEMLKHASLKTLDPNYE